jgi:mannose-1-phosphate guanylyltransferase/mannose-6-phosphate isomerase
MEIPDVLPPVVVVGESHRFITLNQVKQLDLPVQIDLILEPLGRNTAPAICAASIFCQQKHGDVILLVLPADHIIRRREAFEEAVLQAVQLADQGRIVTFGITPQNPETGYGYIEKGEGNDVKRFVEKPDLRTAEEYLKSGNFYWNSGMFAFSSEVFGAEMEKHCPEIVSSMQESIDLGQSDAPFFRLNSKSMSVCPDDSIDYALMEKSDKVTVVPADIGWSDIGSWKALWDVSSKDEMENVLSGDVVTEDVKGSLIRSENRLVAAVGVEDLLISETADAVLVAPLSRSQDVKKIVSQLKSSEREEHILHRTVYRPWGSFTILEEQPAFKIKRITVNPGVKLSLQMHHHRSEHWVVVKGTAKVTCGENEYLVMENQSTYIPCGEKHRLENPGIIPLELIEVQNGSYLGEDDIIRFDDDFGRESN